MSSIVCYNMLNCSIKGIFPVENIVSAAHIQRSVCELILCVSLLATVHRKARSLHVSG